MPFISQGQRSCFASFNPLELRALGCSRNDRLPATNQRNYLVHPLFFQPSADTQRDFRWEFAQCLQQMWGGRIQLKLLCSGSNGVLKTASHFLATANATIENLKHLTCISPPLSISNSKSLREVLVKPRLQHLCLQQGLWSVTEPCFTANADAEG